MARIKYTPPQHGAAQFTCPYCGHASNFRWESVWLRALEKGPVHGIGDLTACRCMGCNSYCIWYKKALAFPRIVTAEEPNPDLPPEILIDYEEARKIADDSPRGAAALLRLSVQKLCKHLGEPGKDINTDIGSLVKKGLSITIQKALDTVRVVGNDAVHPGMMDLRDDNETVNSLFSLVNLIADRMITEPKKVSELYNKLPESKRTGIEKRDAK